jgi:HPt (histidine-containing phosphotransfer) domain-containing protein
MGNIVEPAIADALNRLWDRFRPQIEERVATLETAAAAAAAGTLTQEQQEQASAEAHKLAGVLGTFGLHEGTALAREAEEAYRAMPRADQPNRLVEIAAQLRGMLAGRSSIAS